MLSWEVESQHLRDGLNMDWGWADREAEGTAKAVCQEVLEEAERNVAAIQQRSGAAGDTVAATQALQETLEAVDAFKEAVAAAEREQPTGLVERLNEARDVSLERLGQAHDAWVTGAQIDRATLASEAQADLGRVAPMQDQPRALRDAAGRRLTESEHIVPRGQIEALTTDPETKISDYTDQHYRRDDTVRIERETALNKTHGNRGGSTADNVVTRQLQETVQSGGALNKNEILLNAIDNAKRARDATNSVVTDGAIHRSALGQDGNLFDLQRMGDTGERLGATADEIDRVVADFDLREWSAAGEGAVGKASVGGRLLEGLNVAGSTLGALTGGLQVGAGIDKMIQGETAEGIIDVAEGAANLGLDIGATAASEAGVLATEAGLGAGALATAAGLAAAGGVMLAAETVRSVVKGEETPIDVADKFYGTHFGDIVGWVRGDYAKRKPPREGE